MLYYKMARSNRRTRRTNRKVRRTKRISGGMWDNPANRGPREPRKPTLLESEQESHRRTEQELQQCRREISTLKKKIRQLESGGSSQSTTYGYSGEGREPSGYAARGRGMGYASRGVDGQTPLA